MVSLQEAFQAFKKAKLVDLTHQISETSPHFPALPALEKKGHLHPQGWFPCPAVYGCRAIWHPH